MSDSEIVANGKKTEKIVYLDTDFKKSLNYDKEKIKINAINIKDNKILKVFIDPNDQETLKKGCLGRFLVRYYIVNILDKNIEELIEKKFIINRKLKSEYNMDRSVKFKKQNSEIWNFIFGNDDKDNTKLNFHNNCLNKNNKDCFNEAQQEKENNFFSNLCYISSNKQIGYITSDNEKENEIEIKDNYFKIKDEFRKNYEFFKGIETTIGKLKKCKKDLECKKVNLFLIPYKEKKNWSDFFKRDYSLMRLLEETGSDFLNLKIKFDTDNGIKMLFNNEENQEILLSPDKKNFKLKDLKKYGIAAFDIKSNKELKLECQNPEKLKELNFNKEGSQIILKFIIKNEHLQYIIKDIKIRIVNNKEFNNYYMELLKKLENEENLNKLNKILNFENNITSNIGISNSNLIKEQQEIFKNFENKIINNINNIKENIDLVIKIINEKQKEVKNFDDKQFLNIISEKINFLSNT